MDMMRKSSRFIISGLLLTAMVSVFLLSSVSAETSTTEAQITRIKANCSNVKNILNQIHANDALIRFNRGQLYESMTTKLMSRFNNRVDSNNFDAKSLIAVTTNYGTALATFRSDYISYEEQMSAALNIDCQKEPISFYDAVAKARTKRTQVHSDVVILHQKIDDYTAAFNTFSINFKKISGDSQ
jgi:hypothetical protein